MPAGKLARLDGTYHMAMIRRPGDWWVKCISKSLPGHPYGMAALDGRLQYSAASANIPLLGNIGLGRLRGGEFTEFAILVENAGTS